MRAEQILYVGSPYNVTAKDSMHFVPEGFRNLIVTCLKNLRGSQQRAQKPNSFFWCGFFNSIEAEMLTSQRHVPLTHGKAASVWWPGQH